MTTWARALLIAALAAGTAMPAAAQQGRLEIARRGWLGFSYDRVSSLDARAGLVIRAVSDDSPAQRAGIRPGDMLLEVNGITATQQLVASLGPSLAPGDTVRLRLRRGGRDRTLTLEADERSFVRVEAGVITFSPDTLRRRLLILADSLRVYADTFRVPNVYFRWQGDGDRHVAYWMAPDSARFSWDAAPGGHVIQMRDFSDGVRVQTDSVWRELAPGIKAMRFRVDSLFRSIETDTAWRQRFAVDFDSLAHGQLATFEARAWPGVATLGLRAVAGAELTDLTPGLARAFNTRNGVLVLRVPDHSPARRAGLAEADVIVRVNGAGVESVGELRRIVSQAHTASEPARLDVLRNGKRVVVVLR